METYYESKKGYKQIRSYKLFNPPIGKGSYGIVYKAWDMTNKKLVAIKAVETAKISGEENFNNFKKEVNALYKLNHENIIKIYNVDKTVNNFYIALEYANGGSLSHLVSYYANKHKTGLPESLVQRILVQLVNGIEYIHFKNYIHRDFKLDNILLCFPSFKNRDSEVNLSEFIESNFEGMIVKIADLGFTKDLGDCSTTNTLVGTPITMAPEIIHNIIGKEKEKKNYNNKVDLWSLGAVTYELLIGRPPFIGSDVKKLFDKISNGKYNYPKECMISFEAISFINGLLTFNENNRFNLEEIKKHPFLTKDPNTFHPIDLSLVPNNQLKDQNIEIDSKDANNFLWVMFKNNDLNNLDKIISKDLNDDEVMKSICIINENIEKGKKNMLDRFRLGNKKFKKEIIIENQIFNKSNEDNKKSLKCFENKHEAEKNVIAEEQVDKNTVNNRNENRREDPQIKSIPQEQSNGKDEVANKKISVVENKVERISLEINQEVNNKENKNSIKEKDSDNNQENIEEKDCINNENKEKTELSYKNYFNTNKIEKIEEDEIAHEQEKKQNLSVLSSFSLINKEDCVPELPEKSLDFELQTYSELFINPEYIQSNYESNIQN